MHVTGRRTDGYHELDSLIAFADIHDLVTVAPASSLSLLVKGTFADNISEDAENLVLRAAHALAQHTSTGHGASITLIKNLPVASGIGGGSADAAAALRVLDGLWSTNLDQQALSQLGLSLGADVPVCLFGCVARVQGVGERIAAAPPLPDVGLLLVNPGIPVATGQIFTERRGPFSAPAAIPGSFGKNLACGPPT